MKSNRTHQGNRNTMKRLAGRLSVAALVLCLLAGVSSAGAGAAYVKDIGNSDTLYAYSPSETRIMASTLEQPTQTNPCTYITRFRSLPTAISMGCRAISVLNWIDATRAKLFLRLAANKGECGAIVLDGAWWRSSRIRPADGYVAGVTIAVVSWAPGSTQYFKVGYGNGWQAVTCS